MPEAARLGDFCDGLHPIPSPHFPKVFFPKPCIEGSPNVYVNSLNAARVGDPWEPHSSPTDPPHERFLLTGAPNVFINGSQSGRLGDDLSCFSKVAMGSTDVFIGNS